MTQPTKKNRRRTRRASWPASARRGRLWALGGVFLATPLIVVAATRGDSRVEPVVVDMSNHQTSSVDSDATSVVQVAAAMPVLGDVPVVTSAVANVAIASERTPNAKTLEAKRAPQVVVSDAEANPPVGRFVADRDVKSRTLSDKGGQVRSVMDRDTRIVDLEDTQIKNQPRESQGPLPQLIFSDMPFPVEKRVADSGEANRIISHEERSETRAPEVVLTDRGGVQRWVGEAHSKLVERWNSPAKNEQARDVAPQRAAVSPWNSRLREAFGRQLGRPEPESVVADGPIGSGLRSTERRPRQAIPVVPARTPTLATRPTRVVNDQRPTLARPLGKKEVAKIGAFRPPQVVIEPEEPASRPSPTLADTESRPREVGTLERDSSLTEHIRAAKPTHVVVSEPTVRHINENTTEVVEQVKNATLDVAVSNAPAEPLVLPTSRRTIPMTKLEVPARDAIVVEQRAIGDLEIEESAVDESTRQEPAAFVDSRLTDRRIVDVKPAKTSSSGLGFGGYFQISPVSNSTRVVTKAPKRASKSDTVIVLSTPRPKPRVLEPSRHVDQENPAATDGANSAGPETHSVADRVAIRGATREVRTEPNPITVLATKAVPSSSDAPSPPSSPFVRETSERLGRRDSSSGSVDAGFAQRVIRFFEQESASTVSEKPTSQDNGSRVAPAVPLDEVKPTVIKAVMPDLSAEGDAGTVGASHHSTGESARIQRVDQIVFNDRSQQTEPADIGAILDRRDTSQSVVEEIEGVEDFKPISAIAASIDRAAGDMPNDFAKRRFQEAGEIAHPMGFSRREVESYVFWEAPSVAHQPLYFEDPNLERHGYTIGLMQPVLSAAHFFGRVPALPYLSVAERNRECRYTLGHYRPGSCAPYQIYLPPLSWKGLAAEATAVIGGIYLIP